MSATDYLPRCKYKKNLANDVHCELYFLQKYAFFYKFALLLTAFNIKNSTLIFERRRDWHQYHPFTKRKSIKTYNHITQGVCNVDVKGLN